MAASITIKTSGQTLVVSPFTVFQSSTAVTAYTSSALSTPVTLPATINTDTVFWFSGDGSYTTVVKDLGGGTLFSGDVTAQFTSPATISPVPVSLAQVATDEVSTYARAVTGVFKPTDWGQFWKPKLAAAKAGTGKATIALAGDSVGRGYYASRLSNGWFSLLVSALQTANTDGGSGFQGAMDSDLLMGTSPGAGLTGPQLATYDASGTNEFIIHTGTLGVGRVERYDGPGAAYFKATTAGGQTMQATVRGTVVKVYFLTQATAGMVATVVIDGGTPATVNLTNGVGNQVYTSGTLSAGTHTVVVTATTVPANYMRIVGFSAENATGVVGNNYSQASLRSEGFNNVTGVQGANSDSGSGLNAPAGQWSGGQSYPADLVLYSMGINDDLNNVTPDTWLRNAHLYLDNVRGVTGGATGATDIGIILPHFGKADVTNKLLAEYAHRARGMAEHFGALLINFNSIGRNSYDYWSNLGYWSGGPSAPGVAGSDTVHPSDAGHLFMKNTILPWLS